MRLTHVRVFGFKTFADRTEMSLDGGMVAIVGPNGCGKSNLVDAILWGLGEGSARTLRAATGQDVIFNGAERRKPVGFAEVTLTFDNSDRGLPIDAAEVSITRRLERGGDGKYWINRQPCRLRDVHELLSDSGLGRSGYAIVGQKEIDAALAASPDDRRAWIDEAAGVQRYRGRKTEATRRLAAARDHLEKVRIAIAEIETQMRPLAKQAEDARRYRDLRDRWRELELRILNWDGTRAMADIETAHRAARMAERAKVAAEATLERLRADENVARDRAAEGERQLDAARAAAAEAATLVARKEGELALARQRHADLTAREARLLATSDRATDQSASLEAKEAEGRATDARQAAERHEAALEDARSAETEVRSRLDQIRAEHHALNELRAGRDRAEARAAALSERAAHARRELAGAVAAITELKEALDVHAPDLEARDRAVGDAQQVLADRKQALADLRKRLRESAEATRESDAELLRLKARLEALEAMHHAHEGLAHGPRAVVEAADRGLLSGTYRPVGEAIHVPADLAIALETALGGAVNDLIVAHENDAKAAIEWLKAHRAGRATFQPISLMRPPHLSGDLRDLITRPGIVGRAAELCECDSADRPVIESLLGRVVIAETLDDALRYARTGGWSRLVTREGEVVHAGGAVSGGQSARQTAGVVTRQAEIDALRDKIAALRPRKAADHDAAIHAAEGEIEKAEDALAIARSEYEDAADYDRRLRAELKSAEKDRARLAAELQSETDTLPEFDANRLAEVEGFLPTLTAQLEEAVAILAARRADRDAAHVRVTDLERVARDARKRADDAGLDAAGRERERHEVRAELAVVGATQTRLTEEVESARRNASLLATASDVALNERHRLVGELGEASVRVTAGARHIEDRVREIATQASARETASVRLLGLEARLSEEFGVSGAQPGPEPTSEDRLEAGRLRREIRQMGDVNVGAIEAYQELQTRHAEMTAQSDDVQAGIDTLYASIRELDEAVRTRFVAAFDQIKVNFEGAFARLFEGGHAELILTDPSDVDSGIDVVVQLPGKRRQAVTALSGGERALSTVAFLYALLSLKPSPLVVLDEVDAPLDGANVERLSDLLHELTDRVQFLIITHNPTTIERAPIWLGVSMQEPGVSALIPAQIPMN